LSREFWVYKFLCATLILEQKKEKKKNVKTKTKQTGTHAPPLHHSGVIFLPTLLLSIHNHQASLVAVVPQSPASLLSLSSPLTFNILILPLSQKHHLVSLQSNTSLGTTRRNSFLGTPPRSFIWSRAAFFRIVPNFLYLANDGTHVNLPLIN